MRLNGVRLEACSGRGVEGEGDEVLQETINGKKATTHATIANWMSMQEGAEIASET